MIFSYAPIDAATFASLQGTFSSSDFAGLKDVNGLGELPGAPRTAAELAQDALGLELGVGTLAGHVLGDGV
jgi:hypothetical protein